MSDYVSFGGPDVPNKEMSSREDVLREIDDLRFRIAVLNAKIEKARAAQYLDI